MTATDDVLLDVRGLQVTFPSPEGPVAAVDGLDLTLRRGEVLAVVGESGSGKSATALTLLGLTRRKGTEIRGEIRYRGQDLVSASDEQLRRVRGAEMAMIFQDPLTSLNPLQPVGSQIAEMLLLHTSLSSKAAWAEAVRRLEEVGIPRAGDRAHAYPHEFSGGMRQRAMIAMALACNPAILIADEPTTALDVTIQAQVLALIERLRAEHGAAVVLITHDLGIVADIADRVVVMYAGRIIEQASRDKLFSDPQHPYTWGLLGSLPRLDRPKLGRLRPIEGVPPSLVALPEGCPFRPRCGQAFDRCHERPPLEPRSSVADHLDACWLDPDDKRRRRKGVIGAEAPA